MLRRILLFLFILLILAGIGLVIYSYVAELSSPLEVIEVPAEGVGFSE